jgi:hypothetical protein
VVAEDEGVAAAAEDPSVELATDEVDDDDGAVVDGVLADDVEPEVVAELATALVEVLVVVLDARADAPR